MGTIVAVKKNSNLAIAADCCNVRDAGMRSALNISHGCILRLGETYIGLNSSLGLQQAFEDALSTFSEGPAPRLGNRDEIRNFFVRIHDMLKHRHLLYVNYQAGQEFEWTPMNALVANSSGIYKVDSTRAVYELTRFWALGTGELFALGAMAALYDRLDSAEEIASAALAAVKDLEVDHQKEPEVFTIASRKIISAPLSAVRSNEEKPAARTNSRITRIPRARRPRNRSR